MGKKMVHVEFPAQDLERGKKFWEGVGGWDVQDSGMPGMQYLMWQEDGQGGGIYSMEGQSGTKVYFGNVRELGGEAEDKQPIPGVGWFSGCKDSEGNEFSLFQGDESVAPPQ